MLLSFRLATLAQNEFRSNINGNSIVFLADNNDIDMTVILCAISSLFTLATVLQNKLCCNVCCIYSLTTLAQYKLFVIFVTGYIFPQQNFTT